MADTGIRTSQKGRPNLYSDIASAVRGNLYRYCEEVHVAGSLFSEDHQLATFNLTNHGPDLVRTTCFDLGNFIRITERDLSEDERNTLKELVARDKSYVRLEGNLNGG